MRYWKRVVVLLATILLAVIWTHPAITQADDASATYDQFLLTDYHIPADVVQVIIDNSRYADGDTPAQKHQTPANFTVGDVAQLESVSLADTTRTGTGASTSKPDNTVGQWIAGAEDISASSKGSITHAVDINPSVYSANAAGTVDAANGSLATKTLFVKGANEYPAVNFLFQIIASAKSATRVDLTGVTAQVSDSNKAQMILSLMQTDRLPNLRTLTLAHNNLGTLSQTWQLNGTLFHVTADQRITEVDLSNNNIDNFPWGSTPAIAATLTKLDLAGNPMTVMTDMLNGWLASVINNQGEGDVSGANWNTSDYNTLHDLIPFLNVETGGLVLNDASVNAIFQQAPDEMGPAAIDHYKSQLTVASVQALLNKNTKMSTTQRQALTNFVNDGGVWPTSTPDRLTVGGRLDFGEISLDSLAGDHLAQGAITLTASLNPKMGIYVSMSPWTMDGDPSATFNSVLQLGANSLRSSTVNVTSGAAPRLFYNNSTAAVEDNISTELANITMSIPSPATPIKAAQYQSTMTWTIASSVSDAAN
ncbi:hypothetical protein [Lacticaseibacillus sp. 866-1]|uniref:hypothetical protein n=1 Tax=Lacticaseibacillus sp. 866-1 TaxID=2799576 RepID=UPI0019451F36|nr:hypothetical protein [Lacticaseibacillus sp. 866-1]